MLAAALLLAGAAFAAPAPVPQERALLRASRDAGDEAAEGARAGRLLAEDPFDEEALEAEARLELAAGRLQPALAYAERRAALDGLPGPRRAAALRAAARIRLRLGDEAGARTLLERAAAADPEDGASFYLLAQTLGDRPREALADAGRAADLARSRRAREDASRLAADLALELGDAAAARRALKRAGDGLDARLLRARAAPDPEKAAAEAAGAERAADAEPLWLRPAALRQCARLRSDLGDPARAAADLRRAIAYDPDDLDALEALADLPRPAAPPADEPLAPGAPARSERRLERALRDDPADLAALRELVVLRRAQGRLPEARAAAVRFAEAVDDAPEWVRAAAERTIARDRLALGDAAGARACALRARDLDPRALETLTLLADAGEPAPGPAEALVSLANAREAIGDRAGADALLARALAAAPGDPTVLGAAEGLARARRLPPDDAPLRRRVLRGLDLAGAGDRAGADAEFAAAVAADARGACLGPWLQSVMDRLPPAFFDRCLQSLPQEASLSADRGVARWRLGDREGALADFRRAKEARPDDLEARLSLASALADLGRGREALAEAEEAAALAHERGDPLERPLTALRDSLRRRFAAGAPPK